MPIMTEYCCRIILEDDWEKVAVTLDNMITSKSYERGVTYIQALNIDDDKKGRLIRCLLSYKESC